MTWHKFMANHALPQAEHTRETSHRRQINPNVLRGNRQSSLKTRICAAEMAVRYAALSACRKVHVCRCNSLGGATWRSVTITGRTDGQTDRRTDRVRRREEGRIINFTRVHIQTFQGRKTLNRPIRVFRDFIGAIFTCLLLNTLSISLLNDATCCCRVNNASK